MRSANLFFWLIFCFLLGILLSSLVFENRFFEASIVFVLFLMLPRERCGFGRLLLLIVFLCFGFWRLYIVLSEVPRRLPYVDGYFVYGYVNREVDVRDDKVKYYLLSDWVCFQGECADFSAQFLVNAEKYPLFEFGQILKVKGELIEPFVEDGFDYSKYLRLQGVDYWFKAGEIELIGESPLALGERLKLVIFSLKASIESRIDELFPEPYGSFMKGLLTGSRRGIDVELTTSFQLVGLSHVVAISGYNITLLISVFGAIFVFLPFAWRIAFSAVLVIGFVVLVGASAAVVRAGVMGLISLLALAFGRSYLAFRALFLTAGVMCVFNPLTLLYDVGFQLSFFATLGMVAILPYFEPYLQRLGNHLVLKMLVEIILTTLVSTLMSLPVLISSFNGISLISPLANLLVLPLVPFVMLFGFFSLFFGEYFAFLAYLLMECMFLTANFLSGLSFSFFSIAGVNFYFGVVYYYLLFVFILRKNLTS